VSVADRTRKIGIRRAARALQGEAVLRFLS
jgi:hypothetical protein